MFHIAGQVAGWRAEGRPVWVARVLSVTGLGSIEPAAAAAFTEGHATAGQVLSGSADSWLHDAIGHAAAGRDTARVVAVRVDDAAARNAGLTCGGQASVLLQAADGIPPEVWWLLESQEPVCVITDLDGPHVGHTSWLTPGQSRGNGTDDPIPASAEVRTVFGRGTSESLVLEFGARRVLVSALWPTPRLVIVGDGRIADSLDAVSRLLGWEPIVVNDADEAATLVARLCPGDGVVVLSHDRSVDAPTLAAALDSSTGYVAALGSRRTQAARRELLLDQGVQPATIDQVRGPAGLDIGARTPAEIAVAIIAEMVACRTGASGSPFAAGNDPLHRDGLHSPPAR